MKKIIVFGNSGSGKSTLANELSEKHAIAHLDLDSLAWRSGNQPVRAPLAESKKQILEFVQQNTAWVAEGCYTDLLDILSEFASEIIFLNLSDEQCGINATARPWEPHKYASKQAQDDNLPMLLNWISEYHSRKDEFSYQSHLNFYNRFPGRKTMYTSNTRTDSQHS